MTSLYPLYPIMILALPLIFGKAYKKTLGTQLCVSTPFHPQTDG